MAAITPRLIRLRPSHGNHPYSLRRFSSSSETGPPSQPKPETEPGSRPVPSISSYLTDIKASLQREPPSQNRPSMPRKPLSFSNSQHPSYPHQRPSTPREASFEEIRRNISEYRSRSAPSPPSSLPTAAPGLSVSLQELYHRNAVPNTADPHGVKLRTGSSIGQIRESLQRFRPSSPANDQFYYRGTDQLSIERFRESLKLRPGEKTEQGSPVIGGGDGLPSSIQKAKNNGGQEEEGIRTQLVKMYNYRELGAKLQMLRPGKMKGNWFSLHELNERLARLREIEKKDTTGIVGIPFIDLREIASKSEAKKKGNTLAIDILNPLGLTPSYMMHPPKDHLIEKYFHPDNMSSAEKVKLELKKVRDEYKTSESDCGSARVQVAQLTIKIKHLGSVLSKKDKHSRHGLHMMIERRKKLMKYLRKTDWESFCLLSSTFNIRLIPDTKSLDVRHKKAKKKRPRKS